ncbi:MAG TPA: hypothetical protein DDW52_22230 [Planctomycetaceae bacterium]|nr:hypothetical protein [Planctomycetaceae bacterium]
MNAQVNRRWLISKARRRLHAISPTMVRRIGIKANTNIGHDFRLCPALNRMPVFDDERWEAPVA